MSCSASRSCRPTGSTSQRPPLPWWPRRCPRTAAAAEPNASAACSTAVGVSGLVQPASNGMVWHRCMVAPVCHQRSLRRLQQCCRWRNFSARSSFGNCISAIPAPAAVAGTTPAVLSLQPCCGIWCAAMSVMHHATAGLRPGALQSAALGLTAALGTVMLPRSRQAAPVYAGQCWCVASPPVGSGDYQQSSYHVLCEHLSLSPGHIPAVACIRRQLPLIPVRRCRCTAAPSSHMWWHRLPLPA